MSRLQLPRTPHLSAWWFATYYICSSPVIEQMCERSVVICLLRFPLSHMSVSVH